MSYFLRITISLVMSLSLISCIAIKSDKYFDYKSVNISSKSETKTKIVVNYNYFTNYPGFKYDNNKKPLSDQIIESIIIADCCEIITDQKKAELIIDLNINQNIENPQFSRFMLEFNARMLFIIPYWIKASHQLRAKVRGDEKDKDNVVKDYLVEDYSTHIFWLPLFVPAIFMQGSEKVEFDVVKSVILDFITKLREDGYVAK